MGSFIIRYAIFIGLSQIKIRKKIETNITWSDARWWHDGLWFPTTANHALCSHMTMIKSGSWPLGTVKIIIILLLLLCCFISTETVQTFRDIGPRTSTYSSTQFLLLLLQCCFTSTETVQTFRDMEPRMSTSFFTQLLLLLQCCFTSTETVPVSYTHLTLPTMAVV